MNAPSTRTSSLPFRLLARPLSLVRALLISLKTAISGTELDRRKGTLTANELAAFLELSPATLWRLHSSGKLPSPTRFNRAVRWDRRTIEKWLSDGRPPRDKWEADHPPR
ncbi:MAG: hypothetical protein GIKADHBN_01339 [Phycisphaerales bacterium]|nr:hypothetical protein [Phycisphaerales bacterium]